MFVFMNFTVWTHNQVLAHIWFLQIHMDCSSWCCEILNVSFYTSDQLICSNLWKSACQIIRMLTVLQCLILILNETWIGGMYAVVRILKLLKDLHLEDKLRLRLDSFTVNISNTDAVLKKEEFDCYITELL